eukprot:401463-Rhodomonas_salina.3
MALGTRGVGAYEKDGDVLQAPMLPQTPHPGTSVHIHCQLPYNYTQPSATPWDQCAHPPSALVQYTQPSQLWYQFMRTVSCGTNIPSRELCALDLRLQTWTCCTSFHPSRDREVGIGPMEMVF